MIKFVQLFTILTVVIIVSTNATVARLVHLDFIPLNDEALATQRTRLLLLLLVFLDKRSTIYRLFKLVDFKWIMC